MRIGPPIPFTFHAPERALAAVDWDRAHDAPQDASSLLKLPLELRQRIYSYALGGNKFHMALFEHYESQLQTFEFHVCDKEDNDACIGSHCSNHCYMTSPLEGCCAAPERYGLSVALLRSCRQVYREAVGTLFSENVFALPERPYSLLAPEKGHTLFQLERHLPPGRFHLIRWLDVNISADELFDFEVDESETLAMIPNGMDQYRRVLKLIVSMHRLQGVRLHIVFSYIWILARPRFKDQPLKLRKVWLQALPPIIAEACSHGPRRAKLDVYLQHRDQTNHWFQRGSVVVHGMDPKYLGWEQQELSSSVTQC